MKNPIEELNKESQNGCVLQIIYVISILGMLLSLFGLLSDPATAIPILLFCSFLYVFAVLAEDVKAIRRMLLKQLKNQRENE